MAKKEEAKKDKKKEMKKGCPMAMKEKMAHKNKK
jgi:hypothetical protein